MSVSLTGQLGIFWKSDWKERNAECSKWKQLCVCHCDPKYSMTNGHCIQSKIKWVLIYLIQFHHVFWRKKIILSYFYLRTSNDYTSLSDMIVKHSCFILFIACDMAKHTLLVESDITLEHFTMLRYL